MIHVSSPASCSSMSSSSGSSPAPTLYRLALPPYSSVRTPPSSRYWISARLSALLIVRSRCRASGGAAVTGRAGAAGGTGGGFSFLGVGGGGGGGGEGARVERKTDFGLGPGEHASGGATRN